MEWSFSHTSEFDEYEQFFFADKLWYAHLEEWRDVLRVCHAHWKLDRLIHESYLARDYHGYDPTIALCREQIALAVDAKVALEKHALFEYDYFLESAKRYQEQFPWKRPWTMTRREPVFKLPDHSGFWRLAVILEKTGMLEDGIALCHEALHVGWPGDWDRRMARLEHQLARQKKNNKASMSQTRQ